MKKATRKNLASKPPSQPLQPAAPDSRPRGTRLPQNQVKLRRQASNGQYSITIPAGVAKALRCQGGEVFEVFIEQGNIVLHLLNR
jgi:hypothetical protein